MRQVTTPITWPNSKRNAALVAANIRCQAIDCERQATRWSNLQRFLEDMKPVFGKPSKDQLNSAQQVIRNHYEDVIKNGVFEDWVSQIARTFTRPISKLVPPQR